MIRQQSLWRTFSTTLVALVFSFQSLVAPVLAVDDANVGPQSPVGPQGQVGPVDPVGPQEGIGPDFYVPASPSPSPSPVASPSSAAASSATASAAAPAAGGSSAANTDTGNNSQNTATATDTSNTNVTQNNTANHDNVVNVQAVSGNNHADGNTGNSSVSSGSVNGQVTIVNIANARALDGMSATSQVLSGNQNGNIVLGGQGVALNSRTGNGSQNITQLNRNNAIQINVNNTANINNQINILADTGGNTANDNTGDATVESGNTNLAVNLLNLGNVRGKIKLDVVSVFGDMNGDFVLPTIMANNNTTGANSLNQSTVDANHALTMNTTNNGTINNDVNYSVNTGNNTSSGNTLGGEIRSGTVNAKAAITNVVNAPKKILYVFNIYDEDGVCECDLSALDPSTFLLHVVNSPDSATASNQNTGNNSQNTADVNDTSTTTINENNTANINNSLNVAANTGNNTTNRNTGKGKIKSGNVDIMAQITNLINANVQEGEEFILGIVNIFGKWKGKAVTAAAPAAPVVATANNTIAAPVTLPNPLIAPVAPLVSAAASTTTSSTLNATAPSQTVVQAPTGGRSGSGRANRPSSGTGNTQTTQNVDISGSGTTSGNSSSNGSTTGSTTSTTTTNGVTTTVSSPVPTTPAPDAGRAGRAGTWGRFIGVAHAAAQNGIEAAQAMPYLNIFLAPLALWLIAELLFGAAIRRRSKKN